MNNRNALISSLATIARRQRLNAARRELARAACAIFGALLVYQILFAIIPVAAVLSAVKALLILFLIIAAAIFAFRAMRPTTIQSAAAETDSRQILKDELKSAYWFSTQHEQSPLVELQIHRAVDTAQRLIPCASPGIIPGRIGIAALVLMTIVALTAWFAPRIHYAQSTSVASTQLESAQPSSDNRKPRAIPNAAPSIDAQQSDAEFAKIQIKRENEERWAKLENSIRRSVSSDKLNDLAAAIKTRDAKQTAKLLEELNLQREFAIAQSASRSGAGNQPHASPDLIARLQELFGPGGNVPEGALKESAADELEKALNLAQKLEQKMRASGSNKPENHQLEDGNNPMQAGVPLERTGPREARRSQGQGGEIEGSTDVEGGAMGRRVTQSNFGAGGKPSDNDANASNNIEADSVFGKRTMRLAAKLEQLKIEGSRDKDENSQGVADGVYAATRAQQAQVGYENTTQRSRYAVEDVTSGEHVPLAYRSAVKNYFLQQNDNEK